MTFSEIINYYSCRTYQPNTTFFFLFSVTLQVCTKWTVSISKTLKYNKQRHILRTRTAENNALIVNVNIYNNNNTTTTTTTNNNNNSSSISRK